MASPHVVLLFDSESEHESSHSVDLSATPDEETDYMDETEPEEEYPMNEDHSTTEATRIIHSVPTSPLVSSGGPTSTIDPKPTTKPMHASPAIPPSTRIGPRTIRTARKRVAIPRRPLRLATPAPPSPATDSGSPRQTSPTTPLGFSRSARRRVDTSRWTYLTPVVQGWGDEEGVPPIFEAGESSSFRQVDPITGLHPQQASTLTMARVHTLEQRIERVRDDIPPPEVTDDLQFQIQELGHMMEGMGDTTQELTVRSEMGAGRATYMEHRMSRMEESIRQMTHIIRAWSDWADYMSGYTYHPPGGNPHPRQP